VNSLKTFSRLSQEDSQVEHCLFSVKKTKGGGENGENVDLQLFCKREYVYYESRKREVKTKLIYENRCNERLKKLKLRNLYASHTLGYAIPAVIHT
jgi:hypothetical protein